MIKSKLLIFVGALWVCFCVYGNVFGKGVYYTSINPSGPQFGQHCFVWDQWPDWATYNDWTKVGSDGCESYFVMPTDTDTTEDSLPRSPVPEIPETYFYWYTPQQVAPPTGTWAGYEWSVPETGPGSDQIITGFYVASGYWNYGSGDSAPGVWQLINEKGDVLWTYDHSGTATPWIGPDNFTPNATSYFPLNRTKTIRLVMKTIGDPHWAWGGNNAYAGIITIFTVDNLPYCGDVVHPYPLGDFDKNCVVDFRDLEQFCADWLKCNDPNSARCGA